MDFVLYFTEKEETHAHSIVKPNTTNRIVSRIGISTLQ